MVGCHPKHIAVPKRDPISETENANGTSRLCVSEVVEHPNHKGENINRVVFSNNGCSIKNCWVAQNCAE